MWALRHAGTYSEYLTSESGRTLAIVSPSIIRLGKAAAGKTRTAPQAAKDRQKVEEGEWDRRANSAEHTALYSTPLCCTALFSPQ